MAKILEKIKTRMKIKSQCFVQGHDIGEIREVEVVNGRYKSTEYATDCRRCGRTLKSTMKHFL